MRLWKSSYLTKFYNHYNKEFFGGRLPEDVQLYYATKLDKVKTAKGKKRSTCATTYFYEDKPPVIVVRKTKTKSMRHIASDILHEMCHIAVFGTEDGDCEVRNSKFQKEMKRLANAGAFYNVW